MARTFTTRQIADVLDTDPKNLRYFLRKLSGGPGKGGRYGFSREQAQEVIKKYRKWRTAA